LLAKPWLSADFFEYFAPFVFFIYVFSTHGQYSANNKQWYQSGHDGNNLKSGWSSEKNQRKALI